MFSVEQKGIMKSIKFSICEENNEELVVVLKQFHKKKRVFRVFVCSFSSLSLDCKISFF